MADYANLNVSPLTLNVSNITDGTQIAQQSASAADNATYGFFSFIILMALYIYMCYELFRDDGLFRFDFARSSLAASGFCFIIGAVLVINEFLTSLVAVIWFAWILFGSAVAVYINKQKGG